MTESPRKSGGSGSGGDWRKSLVEASPYLGLGMQLAFSMVFFVAMGYLIDLWLATSPWFTVVGGAVGMVAVLALVVRVSNSLSRSAQSKKGPDASP